MRNILLIIAATLLLAMPAYADEDPEQARKKLQEIEKQLSGTKQKIKQAVKAEKSIIGELDRIDRNLANKRKEVGRLTYQLGELSAGIAVTQSEIDDMSARLEERRVELSRRLSSMYKTHRMGGPWLLLVSGEYGSLMKRYKYLSVMSERDRRLMSEFQTVLAELEAKKTLLAGKLEEFDGLKAAREKEAASAAAEERKKKSLLASVRKKKSSYVAMARELEESSQRMKKLIRSLEEAATRSSTLAPDKFPPLTSGLEWPVDGKVTAGFGRQKHPKFNTYVDRKGIVVAAANGSNVRAVEAAEVVYTDWFKGMGLVAILRHGGNYYTVYANLADIKVKTGDKVARGQSIATVGITGAHDEPSLYFEIRMGSEPIDPLTLLRTR